MASMRSGRSWCVGPLGNQVDIYWRVSDSGSNATTSDAYCTPPCKDSYTYSDLETAWYDAMAWRCRDQFNIQKGNTYTLPDGAELAVDDDGNYMIEEKNARVIYRANRVREFSPHLNASDMLSQFVEYAATVGVKRNEVLNLPIKLFLSWLIIEAAERDGDDVPDEFIVQSMDVKHPRCQACHRFIPRKHYALSFPYCSPDHAQRHLSMVNAV